MNIDLVLLSGTPASGKDTITSEIIKKDNRFVHFKKHKIATGGKLDDTYHLISKEEFDEMAQANQFVQYHYRYGRGYGVSYEELLKNKSNGKIPIIHVGKYENILRFREFGLKNFLSILIYTDRDNTLKRLEKRHINNNDEIENRIKSYDEEVQILCEELNKKSRMDFDLVIRNSTEDINEITLEVIEKINYFENNLESIDDLLCC